MFKLLGGFVIGMFVGAVCVEVLSRTKPELVEAIGGKAEGAVDLFAERWELDEGAGVELC